MLSLNALNKFAPVKKKYLRANYSRFKTLMHRTKLRNKFLKEITTQARLAWSIQRNIYVSPAGIYLLKVNNRNTRSRCKIRSK